MYRLPDDVYQTAKIAKLLLLMEKGQAASYKGKTLEEINIDLDIEVEDDVHENDMIISSEDEDSSNEQYEPPKQSPRTPIVRIPWTKEQRRVAQSFFREHIKNKKPPKKNEIEEMKGRHSPLFLNKTWQQIKVHIQNTYRKT